MNQPIIKKEEATDVIQQAGGFNFDSLEAKAQEIIEKARVEAEAQIERARAEIEKLRAEVRAQQYEAAKKEGYDKGFEEGLANGQEEGRQAAHAEEIASLKEKTSSLPDMISALAKKLEANHVQLREQAERDLLGLSFALAEKLTRKMVEGDPSVVRQVLSAAIDLVLSRSSLEVFASPDDVASLKEFVPELQKTFIDIDSIQIHGDDTLGRGSVVIRAGRGEVAMRLDDELDSIANELLGMSASESRASLLDNTPKVIEDTPSTEEDA